MAEGAVRFDPKISAAIRSRDLATLKQRLAEDPRQLRAVTPFAGGTWLHYAAREGDLEAVRHLLAEGLDVNVGDARDGRRPICDAALGGHLDVVRLLLEHGARLDTSDAVRNPLFSAVVGRSLPVAMLLLDRGLDAEASYAGGLDAIAFAIERGETAIAEEIARRRVERQGQAIETILSEARRVAELLNRQARDRGDRG